MDLSIIVPCRNEADCIVTCLKRIAASNPDAEILVIDGGSDDTQDLVASFQQQFNAVRYFRSHDDRGKGHAIRRGIALARGRVLVQLDADLQFFPEDIPSLIAPILEDRADLVLGTRFTSGSERLPGSTPFFRSVGNAVFAGYTSLLCGQRITDALAGFKAWRQEVTHSFSIQSDRYSYEMEIPIKAARRGWRITEVPVRTAPRLAGESSVRVLKTALELVADGISFRWSALETE